MSHPLPCYGVGNNVCSEPHDPGVMAGSACSKPERDHGMLARFAAVIAPFRRWHGCATGRESHRTLGTSECKVAEVMVKMIPMTRASPSGPHFRTLQLHLQASSSSTSGSPTASLLFTLLPKRWAHSTPDNRYVRHRMPYPASMML